MDDKGFRGVEDCDAFRLCGRLLSGLGHLAVPAAASLPLVRYRLGSVPLRHAGLLAIEFAVDGARGMDDAGASFPSAASFLEFTRT